MTMILPFRGRLAASLLIGALFCSVLTAQNLFEPLAGPSGLTVPHTLLSDESGAILVNSSGALVRSTDDGATWQSVPWPVTTQVRFANDAAGALYVISTAAANAVYRYMPAQNNWQWLPWGTGGSNEWVAFDADGNIWRAAYNEAVYWSPNGGQTFLQALTPDQTNGVPRYLAAYNADHALYGTATLNAGRLYHISSAGTVQQVEAFSGSIDLLTYNRYTGAAYLVENFDKKIRRSANYGLSWSTITFPTPSGHVPQVYAFLFPDDARSFALTSAGLFISTDNGASWSATGLVRPDQLVIRPADNAWFASYSDCGPGSLRRTTDEGATFTDIGAYFKRPSVRRVQQDAAGELYAAQCGSNYVRSFDLGFTWTPFVIPDTPPAPVKSLAITATGQMLALSQPGQRLYRSADGGQSWNELVVPVNSQDAYIFAVEADLWGNVYLLGDFRVMKSADDGTTWQMLGNSSQAFNIPMSNPEKRHIYSLPNGDFLFKDDVFLRRYSAATNQISIVTSNSIPIAYVHMLQNTPNGDVYLSGSSGFLSGGLYRLPAGSDQFELVPFFSTNFVTHLTYNALGALFAAAISGIYSSDDGGLTWSYYSAKPGNGDDLEELIVGTDQHLYAAMSKDVIYRSMVPTGLANQIVGNVWIDTNDDCVQQLPAEPGRAGVRLRADGSADYLAISRPDGAYTLTVPPGAYAVNVVPPNALFEPCAPDVPVSFAGASDSVLLPLALRVTAQCPYLRVGIGTPFLRRCFNSNYTVQYCNDGTAAASGVTVDVTLDSFLQLLSTSLPVTGQNGLTYTFAVGDLAPGQCGTLQLTVKVACDAGLGAIHCSTVSISPNTLCLPALVDQGMARDCQANQGAYDPNDKRAFVDGVQSTGTVPPGEPVEYVIRFQNTGTDTAFTVVIEDQLSLLFDPATVQVLAASHAYTLELHNSRTLRFIFNNIMLPDSNVNEPASHGFVKFRVQPVTDLPLGTPLSNYADIFFDFNDPVRTNTATLTVSWPVSTQEPGARYRVTAFPNPFDEAVTFVVEGSEVAGDLTLVLTDALGRVMRQTTVAGPAFTIRRDSWPTGVYYYLIYDKKGEIGSGKLVARAGY